MGNSLATLDHLAKEASKLLHVNSIDVDVGLGDLGVDSLTLIELLDLCEQIYGTKVDPSQIDQFTSLRTLDSQFQKMQTLSDSLRLTAALHPKRTAIYCRGFHTFSYDQLFEAALRISTWILSNTQKFDRIALYLDKRPEFIAWLYACNATGRIFVPINPALKPSQVEKIMDDCSPKVLVTSRHRSQILTHKTALLIYDSPEVENLFATDPQFNILDSDPAMILYTSGSTGSPKGVILSHRNLVVGAESVVKYLSLNKDDVILSVLPLSFDAGLSQVTTAVYCGAKVVLCQFMRPEEVVSLCDEQKVSVITAVPPLWSKLVSVPWTKSATENVKTIANTGGHMPLGLLNRLRANFPSAKPFLMYGLTEAFRSTYLDPSQIDRIPHSIGKPIPNAGILVLKPNGEECAPYEKGELVHLGPLVSLGYWNAPDLTKQKFRYLAHRIEGIPIQERAVFSGDFVYKDDHGFIYYVSRMDDQIKTSGYRVSPTEIEEVIFKTGLINEVVAFGVPDQTLGQVIFAMIVPVDSKLDENILTSFCKKNLPSYMVPKKVIIASEIPRNPNGKFDRKFLADFYSNNVEGRRPES